MSINANTTANSPTWISQLADERVVPNGRPRPIGSVSVIGAGVMGRGIAAANVRRGIPVLLSDTSDEALCAAVAAVESEIDPQGRSAEPIRGSRSSVELAAADLIIEAAIERLAVKQRIFKKLEPLAQRETIFASNTSSIPITQIAAKLAHPERVVGLHFCHPVAERRLLEIVRGEQTSRQTIATAVAYAHTIGKRPVVVKDSPGFVVNRLFTPYLNEALALLLEGAAVTEIEDAAMSFGMPVGPLAAIDAIGIDVALRAGTIIYEAFPERILPSELLLVLFEKGDLGRKTNRGIYDYDEDCQPAGVSPVVLDFIPRRRRERRSFSPQELTARLILPMLTEAALALDEGLVESPGEIDFALVHGIGFPAATGGLLSWADKRGMRPILEMFGPLASLGPRFQPGARLHSMVADGRGFYSAGFKTL